MTVGAPGDVEWTPDGGSPLLMSVEPGAALWIPYDVGRVAWQVPRAYDDLSTQAGASPGRSRPGVMMPGLVGVIAETASDLLDLMEAMDLDQAGTLEWWDRPTDRVLSVEAVARQCEPSDAAGEQVWSHRRVDVLWLVPRPLEIVEIGGSS